MSNAALDRMPNAYLNGEPITVPACREGESVDICSRCLKTFVVQRCTFKETCQELGCPFK